MGLFGCRSAAGRDSPGIPRKDLLNYDRSVSDLLAGKPPERGLVSLYIEKSAYRLTVRYRGAPLKAYPVVFGRNPVDDKLREGDTRTPEGLFRIARMALHPRWSRFLLLNYPTADSWAKHRRAKARGEIPQRATVGGAIGIHGVPNGSDTAIDARNNWTLGCISLKNADVAELYSLSAVGTPVIVVH